MSKRIRYGRWAKREASKAIRRFTGTIANGGSYRKVYPSWNICDFKCEAANNYPYDYSGANVIVEKCKYDGAIETHQIWKYRSK